jgi:hypothetical protein
MISLYEKTLKKHWNKKNGWLIMRLMNKNHLKNKKIYCTITEKSGGKFLKLQIELIIGSMLETKIQSEKLRKTTIRR